MIYSIIYIYIYIHFNKVNKFRANIYLNYITKLPNINLLKDDFLKLIKKG